MKNNLFEIFLQKIGFSPKKENMYIKVRKTDYDLMKKMIERQDNFSIQIIQQTQQIDTLKNQIELLTKENKKKEFSRRKSVGKTGGLTKQVNKLERKNKQLLEALSLKSEELKIQNKKIDFYRKEIAMLKNKGKKKKDIETYKNYFEARKELEKREKQ